MSDYFFLEDDKTGQLSSGLFWPIICTNNTITPQASSPVMVKCHAKNCDIVVSTIGPLCEKHCKQLHKLCVKPSRISATIRGLFAVGDSECKPVFECGDVISYFGGIIAVSDKPFNIEQNEHHSYVIGYTDRDAISSKKVYVCIDSYAESSGVARFANSIVHKNDRIYGLPFLNAELRCVKLEEQIKIGKFYASTLPCLVAMKDIYADDEIITDYGKEYWTENDLEKLSPAVQDFLNGKTDQEPSFFTNW